MAVDIDQLTTPLVPADVRTDLITIAMTIGLTISRRPSDPSFQIVDWLAKWICYFWNKWAIPALRGQFGALAAGPWLTAWAMGKGVARPLATFSTGPVTLENRTGGSVDVSAVGAVTITNAGGYAFVSQGPAPGSTGIMGAAVGPAYHQTTLVFQAQQTGTATNTASNALAGYPAPLSSGPAGVYIATSGSTPPAGNGALLGSDAMSDPALLALVRAVQAASATPGSPEAKYRATVLRATLHSGVPVATSRVRVYGAGAAINVVCATPSGPTPGSAGDPTTELGSINAAVQLTCAQPGATVTVSAAAAHAINLGTVTLYVTAESGVSAAQAAAAANAAFELWQSLLAIGGEAKVAGSTGYVLFNALVAAFQSQINDSYPSQWTPNTYYGAGSTSSNNGQTFVATAPGTSAGLAGPTGQGGADGASGLVWASTAQTGGGAQFNDAPGVYEVTIGSVAADVALAIDEVATFSYTLAVQIVPQT